MQITVAEVARLLSVTEDAVFTWIRKGAIPVTRVQEQFRFNRADLEWATARGMPISVELFPSAPANGSPAVTLARARSRKASTTISPARIARECCERSST